MFTIVTSRFNNETRDTNFAYRKKYGLTCMYCCPSELSSKILYDVSVFVIEMNNETNKIEGIGLIKNKIEVSKYYKVHHNGNTNRYTYIGKHYIARDIINNWNNTLLNILEKVLFKGKHHSKRGQGLTIFPKKFLKCDGDVCEGVDIDIKNEIKNLFVFHFRENQDHNNDNPNITNL
jgi:hypothetical protein